VFKLSPRLEKKKKKKKKKKKLNLHKPTVGSSSGMENSHKPPTIPSANGGREMRGRVGDSEEREVE
jgi:hypothetical protein